MCLLIINYRKVKGTVVLCIFQLVTKRVCFVRVVGTRDKIDVNDVW